jgi:hypothetical protein
MPKLPEPIVGGQGESDPQLCAQLIESYGDAIDAWNNGTTLSEFSAAAELLCIASEALAAAGCPGTASRSNRLVFADNGAAVDGSIVPPRLFPYLQAPLGAGNDPDAPPKHGRFGVGIHGGLPRTSAFAWVVPACTWDPEQ